MNAPASCERYEREIIEPLAQYAKEGRGQLLELAIIAVGGRQVPVVAFTTGPEVVVTARHHIGEFWGTTETVMRLAASGQEGLTLVPVIDVEHYDRYQERRDRFMKDDGYGCTAMYMWDMFKGHKGWPTYTKNDWKDYKYTGDDSPPQIAAVKGLINNAKTLVDLHNSADNRYFAFTVPTGQHPESEVFEAVSTTIEGSTELYASTTPSSSTIRSKLATGVYEFLGFGRNTSIDYAGSMGRINLGFELPVYSTKPVPAGKWPQLSDIEQLADITARTVLSVASVIGR